MGRGGVGSDGEGAPMPPVEISAEDAIALGWLRRERGDGRRRGFFVRGSSGVVSAPRLAIVGSRAPTVEQAMLAGALAEAAVRVGWAVWSGGADGVDTIAHRATLHARGHTVAVLPAGMAPATPAKNEALFAHIAACGGLLAAAADGATVQPAAFRARNVTLTAAVDALLVVCASERSGSLHAAGRANAIGLPLAAVPWSPRSPNAAGGHLLLETGARCVASPDALIRWLAVLQSATGGAAAAPAAGKDGSMQRTLLLDGSPARSAARSRRAPKPAQDLAVTAGAIDASAGGWQRYAAAPAAPVALLDSVPLTAQQRTLLQAVVGSHPHGLMPDAVAPVEARGAVVSLLLELALEGLVAMDRYGRHLATPAGLRAAEKDMA